MPKASEVKKGAAVEVNGKQLIVKDIDVQSPSARGAATLYKMRFVDILNGGKVEQRFKGDEIIQAINLNRHFVSFSYIDGDDYIFMDNEDYSQYSFKQGDIAEELLFINEETQGLQVLEIDGNAVGLDLPQSVEMVISETSPSIKGASASARTKPAEFATGLVIQVPEYLSPGDKVRVHTHERKYMGRAD